MATFSNSSAEAARSRWNWREYAIEAAGLGLFMLSASICATWLEHPASPLRQALADPLARRGLMGAAMALTAVMLIYSPWGQRSGAHFNPAVTLTFFRLGKVSPRDFAGYVAAQFLGGALAMRLAQALLGDRLADPSVHYIVTQPGAGGVAAAFAGEFLIAFILLTVVLLLSNTPKLAPLTGLAAAACVFLFIVFVAPLSGMSLNPARSLASALAAREATALWIYFSAPPLGMLAAAAAYRGWRGLARVRCAKLYHPPGVRCIFCEHQAEKLRDALGR